MKIVISDAESGNVVDEIHVNSAIIDYAALERMNFERSGRDPKRLIGARYVIEDSTPLGWVSLNKRDFIEWACSYLRDMALALTTMVSSPVPVYFAFYALL